MTLPVMQENEDDPQRIVLIQWWSGEHKTHDNGAGHATATSLSLDTLHCALQRVRLPRPLPDNMPSHQICPLGRL